MSQLLDRWQGLHRDPYSSLCSNSTNTQEETSLGMASNMVHKLLFCFNGLISQVRVLLSSFACRSMHSPSAPFSHSHSRAEISSISVPWFELRPCVPGLKQLLLQRLYLSVFFWEGCGPLSIIAKGCHPLISSFQSSC